MLLHLLPYLRPNVAPPCQIYGALIKGLPTGTEELLRIPTGIEGIEGIPDLPKENESASLLKTLVQDLVQMFL